VIAKPTAAPLLSSAFLYLSLMFSVYSGALQNAGIPTSRRKAQNAAKRLRFQTEYGNAAGILLA
jgi:lipopolysaccharide export LptBFGC system permease protein LptF